MDDNTVELVLGGFLIGILIGGLLTWPFVQMERKHRLDMVALWKAAYQEVLGAYRRYFDKTSTVAAQALRDRLAAALWENRRLKRGKPVDDKTAWLANEMVQQVRESEGA